MLPEDRFIREMLRSSPTGRGSYYFEPNLPVLLPADYERSAALKALIREHLDRAQIGVDFGPIEAKLIEGELPPYGDWEADLARRFFEATHGGDDDAADGS